MLSAPLLTLTLWRERTEDARSHHRCRALLELRQFGYSPAAPACNAAHSPFVGTTHLQTGKWQVIAPKLSSQMPVLGRLERIGKFATSFISDAIQMNAASRLSS